MIKAYALNERGKIELTPEELQKILDEAVEEGKRLAGQPSIVCPMQTPTTVRRIEIGDTPSWRRGCICQDATTATGNGRATSDFSYVTVPQSITGEKTFAAGEKNAREAIDEIKRQFGIKAE